MEMMKNSVIIKYHVLLLSTELYILPVVVHTLRYLFFFFLNFNRTSSLQSDLHSRESSKSMKWMNLAIRIPLILF